MGIKGGLFGPEIVLMENSSGVTTIPVASTATVYTKSMPIKYGSVFAVWLLGSSASGSIDLTVSLEQGYAPPTTEGSADTSWVTPNGISDIVTNRTAETAYIATLSPVPMPYMRFKIVGAGSNNADATIIIRLGIQVEM